MTCTATAVKSMPLAVDISKRFLRLRFNSLGDRQSSSRVGEVGGISAPRVALSAGMAGRRDVLLLFRPAASELLSPPPAAPSLSATMAEDRASKMGNGSSSGKAPLPVLVLPAAAAVTVPPR